MDLPASGIISIAAGTGNLDRGVGRVLRAARTVCYVEYEVTACAILAQNFERAELDPAPVWTDARTFDGRPWRGLVEGVIGGYPCQPFSSAGKLRGADDPRHIWPAIERVLGEVDPAWCFFENVANHLRLGFYEVSRSLQGLGYRVAATLYRAEEVGAPHKRERLFILGVADPDRLRRSMAATGGARGGLGERQRISGAGGDMGAGRTFPPVPGNPEWLALLDRAPHLAPTGEPDILGVDDGVAVGMDLSRKDRIRLIGNGVVPPQAEAAFRELALALVGSS